MPSPSTPSLPSPGLRAAVLLLSMGLVLVTAVAVSLSVSDHLRQTAINEAVRATESIVLGYMGTDALPAAFARPLPADEISVLLAAQAAAELPPRTTLSVA